mmetsp:Transcript_2652/g.7288  ORF Transcript_2652/g.7288 Transcript_2652/m.7288 type:complete len:405 (+) Transcript_2652:97-1311(+)
MQLRATLVVVRLCGMMCQCEVHQEVQDEQINNGDLLPVFHQEGKRSFGLGQVPRGIKVLWDVHLDRLIGGGHCNLPPQVLVLLLKLLHLPRGIFCLHLQHLGLIHLLPQQLDLRAAGHGVSCHELLICPLQRISLMEQPVQLLLQRLFPGLGLVDRRLVKANRLLYLEVARGRDFHLGQAGRELHVFLPRGLQLLLGLLRFEPVLLDLLAQGLRGCHQRRFKLVLLHRILRGYLAAHSGLSLPAGVLLDRFLLLDHLLVQPVDLRGRLLQVRRVLRLQACELLFPILLVQAVALQGLSHFLHALHGLLLPFACPGFPLQRRLDVRLGLLSLLGHLRFCFLNLLPRLLLGLLHGLSERHALLLHGLELVLHLSQLVLLRLVVALQSKLLVLKLVSLRSQVQSLVH